MRIILLHIICVGINLGCFNANAQKNRECLDQVLEFEKHNNIEYDSLKDNNIYMNYVVKSTSWDNDVSISNVKVHKLGEQMHFFSEQANVYKSDQEVYIVMPIQKILIVNTINNVIPQK